jgi:hypothetical protein
LSSLGVLHYATAAAFREEAELVLGLCAHTQSERSRERGGGLHENEGGSKVCVAQRKRKRKRERKSAALRSLSLFRFLEWAIFKLLGRKSLPAPKSRARAQEGS